MISFYGHVAFPGHRAVIVNGAIIVAPMAGGIERQRIVEFVAPTRALQALLTDEPERVAEIEGIGAPSVAERAPETSDAGLVLPVGELCTPRTSGQAVPVQADRWNNSGAQFLDPLPLPKWAWEIRWAFSMPP